jgi:hypothetical protein
MTDDVGAYLVKTALRTYHPVPSLQKTDGNAQDAPRIKNCLKAALLASEFKSVPPSTPDEILEKSVSVALLHGLNTRIYRSVSPQKESRNTPPN